MDPPTFLEITTPDNTKIYKGNRFYVKFKTDAKPEYFDESGKNFEINIRPKGACNAVGRIKNVNGYGTIIFESRNGLKIGSKINITLKLNLNQKILRDTVELNLEEKKKDNRITRIDIPEVEAIPVSCGEPYWNEKSWDEYSVAEVVRTENYVKVYISMDNINLKKIFNKAKQKGAELVKVLEKFYLENLCLYSLLLDIHLYKKSTENIDTEMLENLKGISLESACKTISSMMEDNFQMLEIEASAAAGNS